ncbi:DUF4351 domain-containing protein, partial [Candidatus Cyanaurora vandensis]|uniref:DUF4351 domain-containing protein n=1 Tax=Candidatus Cyanaurora vandensis TaxID=2714958 RepID=UPI0025797E32
IGVQQRGAEDEEMAVQLSEAYLAWETKTKEAGKIEGKIEGKLEGRRNALVQVLTRRFGPLPEEVSYQLQGGESIDELEQWMDGALDATSLADFLARVAKA